ncbi:MAG: amidohydrolase family protein [Vicinamibacterales bacterium]
MTRPLLLSLAVSVALVSGLSARQAPSAQPGPSPVVLPQPHVAFTHTNVVDVRQGRVQSDVMVVVRDGRIVSVGTGAPPAGAAVIDLGGRWMVPGLIDAHTHLATLDAARRALLSGVTTVRSASVGAYEDVAIREMVRAGYLAGPDMLAAGAFVTPADPPWLADPRMVELWPRVESDEALRRLVQINKDRGADVIKTRGTERAGRPETDPREQVYTEAQLRVVVEEATRLGMDVLCHSHGTEGSEAAIQAGVRSIEHGTYLTPAQLAEMARRGIYWVPTYSTVIDLTEPGGDYDDPVTANRGRFMLPVLRRALTAGMKAGVKIVAGADSAYGPESQTRIAHEVANFVAAGMPPLQALQSATTTAAELLRVEARTGAIAPGLEADLMVVEANPLEDVVALQDPLLIMSNGRLALDRLHFGRQ